MTSYEFEIKEHSGFSDVCMSTTEECNVCRVVGVIIMQKSTAISAVGQKSMFLIDLYIQPFLSDAFAGSVSLPVALWSKPTRSFVAFFDMTCKHQRAQSVQLLIKNKFEREPYISQTHARTHTYSSSNTLKTL